ncbi:MAG: type IV pilin protein [Legionellales bacterium]|jgi:type IV pilus assembly protein PilE
MTTHLKPLGFTLIEILTVLLIISLLALMAYPNYMHYIHKSNRLDAANSLFHYQALWQQCLLNTPKADDCLQEIGLGNSQTQASLSSHYQISAQINEPLIIFNAKPVLNQQKDEACAHFTLDNLGTMMAYDTQLQITTKTCWS